MSAPFCNFAGRRFSCRKTQIPQHMAFNRRCMRNSDSSAAKVKNKFFDEVYKYDEKEKSIGNVSAVRSSKRRLRDGRKCRNYAW